MIDCIVPLKWHSPNNFIELKYALRSLEKYVNGVDQVLIIGSNKPDWANNNLIHLKKGDVSKYTSVNIMDKVLTVCQRMHSISDNFLFFNDDHFILEKFEAIDLPYFFDGSLASKYDAVKKSPYGIQLSNTLKALVGYPYHYDIHCPIVYNKQCFVNVMKCFDWSVIHGYAIKSLYCNTLNPSAESIQIYSDLNFMAPPRDRNKLDNLLTGRKFFSTHEGAINDIMIDKLNELYPKKSKYEL